MDVTFMVRKQCHDPEHFKYFEFLKFGNAEWTEEAQRGARQYSDEEALTKTWLRDLKEATYFRYRSLILWNSWDHVEPFLEHLKRDYGDQHAEIVLRVQGFFGRSEIRTEKSDLSLDELVVFLEAMKAIRLAESETLAGELNRLADMYDAHPTRLKMPFAPQTPRPNKKHVPNRLRIDARKLIKWGTSSGWKMEPFKYRFIYNSPALVPYDWCKQLLLRIEVSDCPEEIMTSYKLLREGPQSVASRETDPVDDITEGILHFGIKDTVLRHKQRDGWDGHHYRPSDPAALDWLEALCKVGCLSFGSAR